jgi:tRNA pseudouridine13 synthase
MLIKAMKSHDWDNKIKLGSFERVFNGLDLGSLKGNRFSVALRFIDNNISNDEITQNVKAAQTNGFINYFGMQRFGSYSVRTHTIGKEILNQNWKEVCRLILSSHVEYFADSKPKKEAICALVFDPEVEGDPHKMV